jgi:dTDP-4-dehydrorhamnose reductase
MVDAFSNVAIGTADIAVRRDVEIEMEKIQPDVVINCAGKTGKQNIDWCERHPCRTWYSNALGAQSLGSVCQQRQKLLIHLSSGCMFQSNSPSQVWDEKDRIQAFNFYTRSKLFAEKALNGDHAAIVRIRLPLDFIPHSRNLLSKLIRFKVVTLAMNSVTILEDLIAAVRLIIQRRATGFFHCVSPEPISLAKIKSLMRNYELFSENFYAVNSGELAKLNLVKTQRSDAVLGINRLLDLGFSPESTQLAIERVVAQFSQHWHTRRRSREIGYASQFDYV